MNTINQRKLTSTLVLTVITIIVPTAAVEYYQFRHGQNATVTFFQKLSSYSIMPTFILELFFRIGDHSFDRDGHLDEMALYPDQRGRFSVKSETYSDNFTVLMFIRDIREIDSGVYIVSLREMNEGETTNLIILDAYVDVILPPGKAECSVGDTFYFSHWCKVHCQANAASDGDGLLCYQHSEKALFLRPVSRTSSLITKVFWMDGNFPINCCSYEANFEKDPDSCNDFQYDPFGFPTSPLPDKNVHTRQPSLFDRSVSTVSNKHTQRVERVSREIIPHQESKFVPHQVYEVLRDHKRIIYGVCIGVLGSVVACLMLLCIVHVCTGKGTEKVHVMQGCKCKDDLLFTI